MTKLPPFPVYCSIFPPSTSCACSKGLLYSSQSGSARCAGGLRLIDLAQDAVQLLLGQDVEIDQSIQLDPHHHGHRGSVSVLFSGRAACGCGHTLQNRSNDRSTHRVGHDLLQGGGCGKVYRQRLRCLPFQQAGQAQIPAGCTNADLVSAAFCIWTAQGSPLWSRCCCREKT